MSSSPMTVKLLTAPFMRQVNVLTKRGREAAQAYVMRAAKGLIRSLAWRTPLAAPFTMMPQKDRTGRRRFYPGVTMERVRVGRRGRARAGWWPAASALGVTSVYTKFPNKGEGDVSIDLKGFNPTIKMSNTVSYITRITGHGNWAQNAVANEQVRAAGRLNSTYKQFLARWLT